MKQLRFRTESTKGIATVTFDHPPTRNSLDRESRVELVDELRRLDEAPNIGAIILTGADPAFTSGVDASQLLSDPSYIAPPVDPPTALRELTTPVIAAVNGSCVSGGLEIALACSFIIASEKAMFADTHAMLGLTPGWGLSVELPAAIGVRRARHMTLTAARVDALTALQWGLVNEVVAHGDLLDRCRALAEAILHLPASAMENAQNLYRDGQEVSLGALRALERTTLEGWVVDQPASRAAFSQKAPPA